MIIKRLTILMMSLLICNGLVLADRPITWDALIMRAETAKASFIIGEPVSLTVRLKNNGNEPVVIYTADLGVAYDTIQVHITSDDKNKTEYRMWSVIEPAKPSFVLKKGQSKSFTQRLHWNAATDKLAFPKQGIYQLQVTLLNLTGAKDLVSRPVEISIKPSSKKDDSPFQELFASRHIAGVLAGAAEPDKALVEKLNSITMKYPKSTFTPYVHYALGTYYSRSFFKRKAEPDKATKQFDKALQLIDRKHPLRFDLLNINIHTALKKGKPDMAMKLLKQVKDLREDGLELLQVSAAIDRKMKK